MCSFFSLLIKLLIMFLMTYIIVKKAELMVKCLDQAKVSKTSRFIKVHDQETENHFERLENV